jgi:hypothetical protein
MHLLSSVFHAAEQKHQVTSATSLDRNSSEDMAAYFRIGIPETVLLYRLGQMLSHATPVPVTNEFQLNG